jgi:hypothetical protein
MPRGKRQSARLRFWQFVKVGDGCWLWQGGTNEGGYGSLSLRRGVKIYAHRLSFELNIGPVPLGLWVLHRCDNPRCVNPAHLFVGTRADNMRDAHQKGRTWFQVQPDKLPRGATHHKAKLDEVKAGDVRARYAVGGVTQRTLAEEYNVSQSTIQAVLSGRNWNK